MKQIVFIMLVISNLFAIEVNNKSINIGDSIGILDSNIFSVRMDSVDHYKYVAINKGRINISGFNRIIIEATPKTGIIYNIMLLNQSSCNDELDSLKSFFNEHVLILENMFGLFDFTSDNGLPYKDSKNVIVGSMMFRFYKDITIFLSINSQGFFNTVQIIYISQELKEQWLIESMDKREEAVRKIILNKLISN